MRTALVAACLIAVALAGCADEPEPVPPPQGTTSHEAIEVLAADDPTMDGTLIGLFAHGAPASRVPWPLGPVGQYEHMHRSSGKNGAMDRGAASDWYSLHLERTGDGPKIVFSDIGAQTEVQRSFNAEHFGWPLEWDAPGLPACAFSTGPLDGLLNSTDAWAIAAADPTFQVMTAAGGKPMMLLLPERSLTGDCNGRTVPLGFAGLPEGPVWAVFWTDLDAFIGGGSFIGGGALMLDAATGASHGVAALDGPWGAQPLRAETVTETIQLPGTPLTPWQSESAFAVPEGAAFLDVSTRWISGPDLMGEVTVTLEAPDGSQVTMPTHGDWTRDAPAAGGWKIIHSSEQAPPGDVTFGVAALAG